MIFLKKKEFKLFLTFLIIYLTFLQFSSWTSRSKMALAMAVVYDHSLQIDNWKDVAPFATAEFASYNGHYYSTKPPLESFLAVPEVFLFKLFFGYPNKWHLKYSLVYLMLAINSALSSALTCVILYKLLKHFTKKEGLRTLVTVGYGLGTMAFYNATNFEGYTLGNFFLFASFYLLFKMKSTNIKKGTHFLISGILIGLAFASAYTYIFAIIGILGYIILSFKNWKYTSLFMIGLAIPVSAILTYNLFLFGNPLEVGYFHMDQTSLQISGIEHKQLLMKYPFMLFDVLWKDSHLLTKIKIIMHNMVQMLFFPFKGLFVYYPLMLFCLLGLFYMQKEHNSERFLILYLFLVYLLFLSTRVTWWFSGAIAVRHFSVMTPFFMLPLVCLFKKMNKKLAYAIIAVAILICFVTLQNPHGGDRYTLRMSVIKHLFICQYQTFLNPLSGHFIPYFLKFGPTSYLLEYIFGKRFFPFSNLLVISIVLFFIWKQPVLRFIKTKRNCFLAIMLILFILAGLRIAFNSEVTDYAQTRYQEFLTEKEDCKPLWPNNFFTSLFLVKDPDPREMYKQFNIPSTLEISPDINSCCQNNKNWYLLSFFDSNTISMSQDATIELVNKQEGPIKVKLEFTIESWMNKTLVLYLNNQTIGIFSITSEFNVLPDKVVPAQPKHYSHDIVLPPGKNVLVFHALEDCDLVYDLFPSSKDLRCISFAFRKIKLETIPRRT